MYEEDFILVEKWKKEEREKRLKERENQGPIYSSSKAKRNIEGSQTFGYVKETEDVSKLHKNVITDDQLNQLPERLRGQEEGGPNSIEGYFEGMNDDDFEKGALVAANKSKRKDAVEIQRLKKEASRSLKMTDEDRRFKAMVD